MEGAPTEGRLGEVVTSLKRFATDIVVLLIFTMLSLLIGSFFQGREITLLGKTYPLGVALFVLFAAIFLTLTSLLFRDLKKMLDNLSVMVVRHFPGMKEDVPPITRIMRSLVQIIIILLLAAVVVPLTSGLRHFGITITSVISALFLLVIIIFIYIIARNLYAVTQGYVGSAITNFLKEDSLLVRRKRRKKSSPSKQTGEDEPGDGSA